jgi:flagellar export protein FliJ
MRRFNFRLETVLRHRCALLRETQRLFAEARAEAAKLEQAILSMDEQRGQCQEMIRKTARGQLERTEMLRLRSYANVLWLSLLGAGQKLAGLRAKVDERRGEMVKAQQNVRALELLREKAVKEWKAMAGREERRLLDDLQPTAGLLDSRVGLGGELR